MDLPPICSTLHKSISENMVNWAMFFVKTNQFISRMTNF